MIRRFRLNRRSNRPLKVHRILTGFQIIMIDLSLLNNQWKYQPAYFSSAESIKVLLLKMNNLKCTNDHTERGLKVIFLLSLPDVRKGSQSCCLDVTCLPPSCILWMLQRSRRGWCTIMHGGAASLADITVLLGHGGRPLLRPPGPSGVVSRSWMKMSLAVFVGPLQLLVIAGWCITAGLCRTLHLYVLRTPASNACLLFVMLFQQLLSSFLLKLKKQLSKNS